MMTGVCSSFSFNGDLIMLSSLVLSVVLATPTSCHGGQYVIARPVIAVVKQRTVVRRPFLFRPRLRIRSLHDRK